MQIFSRILMFASLLASFSTAQDCQIVVPPRPLTAAGLATPYKLRLNSTSTLGCTMADPASQAFVHAAIINLNTGAITVYNPLMITAGDAPAIPPTIPTLPASYVIGIWFGFNGNSITLVNAPGTTSLTDGKCVNGLSSTDIFGQFAACNAPAFFSAAKNAIYRGLLTVPRLGTATDGLTCPNVRDWFVVDQDQSDNVPATYILDPATGLMAMDTTANRALLAATTANIVSNPSDNGLVDKFMMPAMGCTAWTVTNLADPTGPKVPALPLNELQAEYWATKPQALIPLLDPMVLSAGAASVAKLNLYRQSVNQPQITSAGTAQASTTFYCKQMNTVGATRLNKNKATLAAFKSPNADFATLFDFLANRFAGANTILDCAGLGVTVATVA